MILQEHLSVKQLILKQEGHWLQPSPEKTSWKSINTVIWLSQCWKKSLFSLWELNGFSFEQTWIPFTQWCFVPILVEIDPVVLEKKMKMWKVYDNNNDADANDDGQRTNFDQKSSFEPSALMWAKKERDKITCCSLWARRTQVYMSAILQVNNTDQKQWHTAFECGWHNKPPDQQGTDINAGDQDQGFIMESSFHLLQDVTDFDLGDKQFLMLNSCKCKNWTWKWTFQENKTMNHAISNIRYHICNEQQDLRKGYRFRQLYFMYFEHAFENIYGIRVWYIWNDKKWWVE